jgi:hypothetical protein
MRYTIMFLVTVILAAIFRFALSETSGLTFGTGPAHYYSFRIVLFWLTLTIGLIVMLVYYTTHHVKQ